MLLPLREREKYEKSEYAPFGERISQGTTEQIAQRTGYSGRDGHFHNPGMFYRYRTYNAGIGRFAERDPIGNFGGINIYAFVSSSPVTWYDPFGLREVYLNFMIDKQTVPANFNPKQVQDYLNSILAKCFKCLKEDKVMVLVSLTEQTKKKLQETGNLGKHFNKTAWVNALPWYGRGGIAIIGGGPILGVEGVYTELTKELTGWTGYIDWTGAGVEIGRNATNSPYTQFNPGKFGEKLTKVTLLDAMAGKKPGKDDYSLIYANFIAHEQLFHGFLGHMDDWFTSNEGDFGNSAQHYSQAVNISDSYCEELRNKLGVK